MFAYCGNNPIVNVDPNGDSWWGWLAAAVVVTTLVVASVVTCGGAAVAAGTACAIMTGSCTAVGTTATVLTGAAVGASTAFAATVITAASESHSMEEFADYGDAAFVNTTVGAGIGTLQGLDNANNYCFIAGTLVYTETGERPIEEILPGDLVWAWDEETGNIALKPVVETYINEADELIHIFVDGEEIVCTPSHPFYAPQNGWTDACKLRAGDILVLVNGDYVVVEQVQHELLEAPVKTYNFQVQDYHTYYVASGVLVHNKCFRDRVAEQCNSDGVDQDAHHVFPQHFKPQFDDLGININETKYGTMINSGVHRGFSNEYDQDWFYFFKGSPTKDQAIRFGKMLSEKYGFKIYFQ